MQTPKARSGTLEAPERKSSTTPSNARHLKTPSSNNGSVSSPNPSSKTPRGRTPKITEIKSSLPSPLPEKKLPSRVPELESQLAQLQEDLKRAKDQLHSSESLKNKAQQEAEEARKHLLATSNDLEESQQQHIKLSSSEEERLQERCKISQDRDHSWQSELDTVQKQHVMDSAALVSAINEIQKLKIQLQRVRKSEATQINNAESAYNIIQNLRVELDVTLSLVEKLKMEVRDCEDSESRALEVVGKIQMQLEAAKKTMEMLELEAMKAYEVYKSLALELEQSRALVKSLEELGSKFEANIVSGANKDSSGPIDETGLPVDNVKNKEINQLKSELISTKSEVRQLKSALEVAEVRYQQHYIQSKMQLTSAHEQLELTKSESSQRQDELYEELKNAVVNIEELRATLVYKEYQLQGMSEENEGLKSRIMQNRHHREREYELLVEQKELHADIANLKAKLMDRETELQNFTEENNSLKMEIKKGELEKNKISEEAIASIEAARAAEYEALIKLCYRTEEADKSNQRVSQITVELDAVKAVNSELEAELRRLKVQSDQWRKAAEAAATIVSTGNNAKPVEKTGSFDRSYISNYNSVDAKTSSPYSEGTNNESPKNKKTNMLKKIGMLWKKNHY